MSSFKGIHFTYNSIC